MKKYKKLKIFSVLLVLIAATGATLMLHLEPETYLPYVDAALPYVDVAKSTMSETYVTTETYVVDAYNTIVEAYNQYQSIPDDESDGIPTVAVAKRSYPIDICSVGELEAAQSISIASAIRSDQPKVIDIIHDGAHVIAGDLLVKIDATPFEKKIEELDACLKECQGKIEANQQALNWELDQASHEAKAIELEMESAQLELNKIVLGDGPIEMARLKSTLQKSKTKHEELLSYFEDLKKLEAEGIITASEVKQTEKKLFEEKESFENAKMQFKTYKEHVYPMLVKKGETALKRLTNAQEETVRSSKFNIDKAKLALKQSEQQLTDTLRQLQDAKLELALTEIRAPSSGMVVHREEFRSNQRRKPRVGDILVRNQAILDLPDLSSMVVKTKVREVDLYKIDLEKKCSIEVDAYPHTVFPGKVIFIGILALADIYRPGDEKYFEMRVSVDKNQGPTLRPGMTARIVTHASNVENALSVPIHAVFEFNKKLFCFVKKSNGLFVKQPVQIGMSNEEWTEIVTGLKEYDRVSLILPPEHLIQNLNEMTTS